MNRFVFAYPGNINTPTGGYIYDRRVFHELTLMGWKGKLLSLGSGFPNPAPETLTNAENLIANQETGIAIIADCLAWGVMDQCSLSVSATHRIIPLVHHPLCLETGLSDHDAKILFEKEKVALSNCKSFITTSQNTGEYVQKEYGISPDSILVAEPGVDNAAPAIGRNDNKVGLLSVGSVIPRKGYDKLVEILKPLEDLSWHLDVVGETKFDPDYFESITKQVNNLGLANRIIFHGAMQSTELDRMYHQADLFVLASQYEGFGMAFTEATVRGIPIIATGTGAVSSTVPEKAGMVFEPNQLNLFADALKQMITNKELRKQTGKDALIAAKSMGSWRSTATKIAALLE